MMIEVVAAIIEQDGKILLAKRPSDKHQGGKWEFPGGKIEPGESPLDALKREIKEEIDLDVVSAELYQTVEHHYEDKAVRLYFLRVNQFSGAARGAEGQAILWVPLNHLKQYEFPEANQSIVRKLTSAQQ